MATIGYLFCVLYFNFEGEWLKVRKEVQQNGKKPAPWPQARGDVFSSWI